MLDDLDAPTMSIYRDIIPISKFSKIKNDDKEVQNFLREEISKYYAEAPQSWALGQIKESIVGAKNPSKSFKPRQLFVAKGIGLEACCLTVLKRGGSAKLILLSNTSHVNGLVDFLDYIAQSIKRSRVLKIRKLYGLSGTVDADLCAAFERSGYVSEGVLEAPYRPSVNMVVYARPV